MWRHQKTLNVFLRAIANGHLSDLGILADWLEEVDHPKDARVRYTYRQWRLSVDSFVREPFSVKRRLAKWESIASWHRWARRMIAHTFKRKWRPIGLVKLWDLNREKLGGD